MREIDLLVSPAAGQELGPQLAKAGPAPVRIIRGLEGLAPRAILAADVEACTPEQCARLRAQGVDVVMMSAVRSPEQEEAYLAAGAAAYVDMIVNDALVHVLEQLAG